MASPLKIGIVVHCPSPHQKILLDQLCHRPDADVVVAYAYPTSPNRNWGTPIADGRTVMVPGVARLGSGRHLREWISSLDRDVWILGSAFPYARTQALAAALARTGLPWAYLGEPPRPRTGVRAFVRDFLLQRVLRRCNGVIATGVEPARRYAALLADGRPVTSVPYHIPLTEWLDLPFVEPPASGEPLRFLTLGQLIPRKGLDLLIKACASLPRHGWVLDIYGDGPERRRLQHAIDASHLPITLHRPLPFDRRIDAFRGAHCFVFPSRWDGWGMAPVEALAAGLPVIATDQTMSAYEFISHEVNGWVVPCEPAAISGAMVALLRNPSQLASLSRAARATVAKADPSASSQEIVRFCGQLLEAATARRQASG